VSNRDRDFRQPRRRDYADDDYQPPSRGFGYAPPRGPQFDIPSGPPVRGTVKWYNPDKGFGFVELGDGTGDAFLHVSVVERSGHNSVPAGATLEVRASPGQKGPQVTEILNVDISTRGRSGQGVRGRNDQAMMTEPRPKKRARSNGSMT
jgi:CspA family cold shock protein